MADYMHIPAIDDFIAFVEHDSNDENSMKAMLSATLSHRFPITHGFALAPKQGENSFFSHFALYRIQYRFPGDRGLVDHASIQATRSGDTLDESLSQLLNALDIANSENNRCWAILAIGMEITFYEYHQELPKNKRLLAWCPPGQRTNSFNIRHDCELIDWMFNYMRQNNGTTAR